MKIVTALNGIGLVVASFVMASLPAFAPAFAQEHLSGELPANSHVEHHGGGGLPQFDPSTYPSQIFWLIVAFVILYMIFSNKTLPEISSTLENRREHIKSDLDTAERLRADADKAQEAYEESLRRGREEATALLEEALASARGAANEAAEAFGKRLENEVRIAEQRVAAAKLDAQAEMEQVAAEIASQAAEKIIGVSTDMTKARNVVDLVNKQGKVA